MAKRFTNTNKFEDPWYRRLSSANKLLWEFLLCKCDHSGIIVLDFELAEMMIGEKYDDNTISAHFSDRIISLGESKYFIPKFIDFQYGKLSASSKVHKSVIENLTRSGVDWETLIPYPKGIHTTKEKDKDKDRDKEKEKEKEKEEEALSPALRADGKVFGLDECHALWEELGNGDYPELSRAKMVPNSCREGFAQLAAKYLRTEDAWREYFITLAKTGFADRNRVSINMALKPETFERAQNGAYGFAKEEFIPGLNMGGY